MGHQLLFLLAEEDLAKHREQIDRCEDHADGGQPADHHAEGQGVGLIRGETSEHHQFAHEPAHAGQGQGGEGTHRPEREHDAHLLADASHLIQLKRVGAVVGGTHEEEQAGANQAVADHLQHGATGAQGTEAAHADQHEAHVADRAVGDLSLEVALGEGGEGGVNDVHHPQHDQQWGELRVGRWQQFTVEAQQGIAAHLQQDAGQQHVHRCRCFAMGIRQPGVQRHDRKLHAEGDQQPGVAEQLKARAEVFGCKSGVLKTGGAAAEEAHGQGGQQDEQGAAGGVEDEFGCGVLAFLAAPDGQQQIHRDQFQLPGQEEQQHVLHGEHSDLAAVHGQQQEIKQPRFETHRPCRQAGQAGDEAGEQDQRHREPVGSHRPGEAKIRQPAHPFGQLQTTQAGVIAGEVGRNGDQEGDQRHDQGVPAHLFALAFVWNQRNQQGTHNRHQDRQAQPWNGGLHRIAESGDCEFEHADPILTGWIVEIMAAVSSPR